MLLLEYLQHPQMRESTRKAAAQSESHTCP
jgi:hypothetical protein